MANYIETKNTPSTLKPSRGFVAMRLVKIVLMTGLNALTTWNMRARQRRHLERMDDWQLKDIGLNRSDVYQESHKPFWRH